MKTRLLLLILCFIFGQSTLATTAKLKAQQATPSAAPGTGSFMPDQTFLQGLWAQPCTNGTLRTERFSGSMVILNENFFSDRDCRKPAAVFINEGIFVLPQPGFIDFQFTSVRLRLLTEVAINDFNKRRVCGLDSWKLGEEKDVTGRSCEMFVIGFPQRIPTAGEMRYGIYRLDKNLGQLAFGKLSKERNATTPDKRPEEFDPRYYQKVPHLRPGHSL